MLPRSSDGGDQRACAAAVDRDAVEVLELQAPEPGPGRRSTRSSAARMASSPASSSSPSRAATRVASDISRVTLAWPPPCSERAARSSNCSRVDLSSELSCRTWASVPLVVAASATHPLGVRVPRVSSTSSTAVSRTCRSKPSRRAGRRRRWRRRRRRVLSSRPARRGGRGRAWEDEPAAGERLVSAGDRQQQAGIDVAAERIATVVRARPARPAAEQRRDADGAGALDDDLAALEQQDHRLGVVVVVDDDLRRATRAAAAASGRRALDRDPSAIVSAESA